MSRHSAIDNSSVSRWLSLIRWIVAVYSLLASTSWWCPAVPGMLSLKSHPELIIVIANNETRDNGPSHTKNPGGVGGSPSCPPVCPPRYAQGHWGCRRCGGAVGSWRAVLQSRAPPVNSFPAIRSTTRKSESEWRMVCALVYFSRTLLQATSILSLRTRY